MHEGLKETRPEGPCWDVWLQPQVLESLRQWRESLDPASWARAVQITGHLAGARAGARAGGRAGGQRVTPASFAPWRIASCGDLHAPVGA